MKKITLIFLVCTFLNTVGCQSSNQDGILKVGTIAGPETDLMVVAQQVAKEKYDLDIKIVEFSDYAIPNQALADGSIDANVFQHEPYLQMTNSAKGYNLVSIGKTFIYPMGIYSNKIGSLDEMSEKSLVGIPNDPTNEARALLLLQKAHLITLASGKTTTASVMDIKENPKHLKIKTMNAAQLPRALPDLTAAVINTTYAISSGLSPNKDAIYLEDQDSDYANIIVVRESDVQDPNIKKLARSIQSPEVEQAAGKLFHGQALVAW